MKKISIALMTVVVIAILLGAAPANACVSYTTLTNVRILATHSDLEVIDNGLLEEYSWFTVDTANGPVDVLPNDTTQYITYEDFTSSYSEMVAHGEIATGQYVTVSGNFISNDSGSFVAGLIISIAPTN